MTTTRRSAKAEWLRLAGVVIARTVLWTIAGLVLWAVALVPFGNVTTIVDSGSMSPSIRPGDVVVTRPINPDTEVLGRVVTADDPAEPGTLLTHRIVWDNHDGTYVSRGDANEDAESTPMPRENIKGRGFLLVPWVGLPAFWVSTGQVAFLAITALGLTALVMGARDAKPGQRTSGRRLGGLRTAGT